MIRIAFLGVVILSFFVGANDLWQSYSQAGDFARRLFFSRAFVVMWAAHLGIVGLIFWRRVGEAVKRFFLTESYAVNLAVFRIFVFGWFSLYPGEGFISLSRLPREMHVASWHLPPWFLDVFPINPTWAAVGVFLFRVCCILACVGLGTRCFAFLAMIIGFYVLGAPHYIGKLNHYHHQYWFLCLLAVSRCHDALSIDYFLKQRKQSGSWRWAETRPSVQYALPLRFVWLHMGILYFFPGFWKIWDGGLDWIFSGHLRNYMYFKWWAYDFIPFFRLDLHPTLLATSAALVVFFEMSFIFLIFSERLRPLAVLGGLYFHTMTKVYLDIFFNFLVLSYISFVDWQNLVSRWQNRFSRMRVPMRNRSESTMTSWRKLFKDEKPYGVFIIGVVFLVGNIFCGMHKYHSWPFSTYPTFSSIQSKPTGRILTMSVKDESGRFIDYDRSKDFFNRDQHREFLLKIQHRWNDKPQVEKLLKGFFESWLNQDGRLREAASASFYVEIYDLRPETKGAPPIKREKIYELHHLLP